MRYAIAISILLLVTPCAVAQVPMNYCPPASAAVCCPPASSAVCCPTASAAVCCPPASPVVYSTVPVQAAAVCQPTISSPPATTFATPRPLYGNRSGRMLGGGYTRTGSYKRSVQYVAPTAAPVSAYYWPY
ncbi:MAG: hypothetical protein MK171_13880 [Pirellulales bacterium]|nr:hypothetical protein [Pirellulales bacterium]